MTKTKVLLTSFFIVSTLSLLALRAQGASSPLSVAVINPVQFPSDEFSITGARLSLLWGQHRDVYGLDFGVLGNITEQSFVGIGISGLANWTKGETTAIGLQAAGLANVNKGKTNVYGLQVAAGGNFNIAASSVTGVQLSLVNYSAYTTIYGVQAGIYNKAQEVYGFQIGLVNETQNLHGIQIGLVNFHHKGVFSVSPILNVGF